MTKQSSKSGNDSAVARTSSLERFNQIYNMAKSHLSGVKDYVMPKQSGDRRRGVIEVRCRVLFGSVIRLNFSCRKSTS